ncbi:hypothetical protein [Marivita hallyeonensis]|nr:hypothetical protein [Marivita hallyeonensis]
MKTFMTGAVLAGMWTSSATAKDDLVTHVSQCVGRMSAQIEHQWLFQDSPTDMMETQRAHLIDVLQALTTSANASKVLSGRIDAKMAHATLLTKAAFGRDERSARWAKQRALQAIQNCGDLVFAPDAPGRNVTQDSPEMPVATVTQDTWKTSQ